MFGSVTKILSTCVLFSNAVSEFLQRIAAGQKSQLFSKHPDENSYSNTGVSNKKLRVRTVMQILENESWKRLIHKFNEIFSAQLNSLIEQASAIVATQYDHFLSQLLLRLGEEAGEDYMPTGDAE